MEGNKFKNKYRIESSRLSGYDYGQPGWFFITINTKNRTCWFGDVVNNTVLLSNAGRIVTDEWKRTAEMRPHVRLDEWVVMPNHMHMLFAIVDAGMMTTHDDTVDVETHCNASLPTPPKQPHPYKPISTQPPYKNEFGPQRNNVASIIRGFKGVCTNRIKSETPIVHFAWQPRFYDRIIRDERGIYAVRQYIRNNPGKWHHGQNH